MGEARALGFPIVHKHKLSCLRQELIDAFVESRYMMFIKYAAVQLQQLGLRKQMDMFSKDKPNLAIEEKEKFECKSILNPGKSWKTEESMSPLQVQLARCMEHGAYDMLSIHNVLL